MVHYRAQKTVLPFLIARGPTIQYAWERETYYTNDVVKRQVWL